MPYTIRELADANGLTIRALRFYEGKGLLSPRRHGSTRAYSENDALRLAQIVRGARFGLTLREIKQYLEETPSGPWLNVPWDIAARQAEILDKESKALAAAVASLIEIATAGKPVETSGAPVSYRTTAEEPQASPSRSS